MFQQVKPRVLLIFRNPLSHYIDPEEKTLLSGRLDVNNSDHYFGLAFDWRIANLALQQRMGILPEWWTRPDRTDRDYPGLDGSAVADPTLNLS